MAKTDHWPLVTSLIHGEPGAGGLQAGYHQKEGNLDKENEQLKIE